MKANNYLELHDIVAKAYNPALSHTLPDRIEVSYEAYEAEPEHNPTGKHLVEMLENRLTRSGQIVVLVD